MANNLTNKQNLLEKTNVYKFYTRIHTAFDQEQYEYKTIYCSGLGTSGKYPFLGGFFGYGITNQIISAYQYISINYRNEKDQIWLIGFSRGGKIYNYYCMIVRFKFY